MAEKPRRKDEPSGKRGRGRPVEKEMPEPIPDTPENVARALLSTPPKDDGDWDYMKDREFKIAGALLQRKPKKGK